MNTQVFIKSIMAGVMIGIAGLIFLNVQHQIIGSIMFSFGLLMVLSKGYFLYTGKVGYLLPYQKGYLIILLKTLLGNAIGIFIIALLYRFSGATDVITRAESLYMMKLSNTWYQTLILSILCGMMMYIAVQSYHKQKIDLLKILIVILSVSIFILAKFEHSVANMLYLMLGQVFTIKSLIYLSIMIIGNAIGAISLNLIECHLEKTHMKS